MVAKTKVVIRKIPPNVTEREILNFLLPIHSKVNYFRYEKISKEDIINKLKFSQIV